MEIQTSQGVSKLRILISPGQSSIGSLISNINITSPVVTKWRLIESKTITASKVLSIGPKHLRPYRPLISGCRWSLVKDHRCRH
jgi:hypothetical protein